LLIAGRHPRGWGGVTRRAAGVRASHPRARPCTAHRRWNGRVAVDIRDAEPDRTPFLVVHDRRGGHDRPHAPFAFVDGTIDRVIVDVRGEHDVHHEREVLV
jgi:hypothetical protein